MATPNLDRIEKIKALEISNLRAEIERLRAAHAANRNMREFLERLSAALYSSDFTEPLGQYKAELFYREAKELLAVQQKEKDAT